MALMFAICNPQPNWMPRKPKLMFQICQNVRGGLSMDSFLPHSHSYAFNNHRYFSVSLRRAETNHKVRVLCQKSVPSRAIIAPGQAQDAHLSAGHLCRDCRRPTITIDRERFSTPVQLSNSSAKSNPDLCECCRRHRRPIVEPPHCSSHRSVSAESYPASPIPSRIQMRSPHHAPEDPPECSPPTCQFSCPPEKPFHLLD